MVITVELPLHSYDIVIEEKALEHINDYLKINSKVLILSDSGVPQKYIDCLSSQLNNVKTYIIPMGEENKNFFNYQKILEFMVNEKFTRSDVLIALGGGVVGDLGGFVASTFMRGITFYNIPTTLLSQVDSSIGGKTGIDFMNYKNMVGTFYQPSKVIIDPLVLDTLDDRLFNEGLAEVIKMSITFDKELFELIESSSDIHKDIEEIIIKSLLIKKDVVEIDEKEKGLRRVLNFGHTIGHAVEALGNGKYYHGEAVAIGMVNLTDEAIRPRLIKVLKKYNLPTINPFNKDDIFII